jgi:hypothetical protein
MLVVSSNSSYLPAMPAVNCLLPKLLAIGVLRSFGTPDRFSHRPGADQRFARGTPSPFAAFRRGKVSQFGFTFLAVNTPLGLGAVPKTAAPFANFQVHAQFHDEISVFSYFPDGFALTSFLRGVERTRNGCSGFLRPDGG